MIPCVTLPIDSNSNYESVDKLADGSILVISFKFSLNTIINEILSLRNFKTFIK